MRFNARGEFCAGVKGDGGVASLNGVPVLGPSAQCGGWFGDRIVCQFYTAESAAQIIAVPGGEVLAERGANTLKANGGVWAARLDGFGLFSSTGFGGPDWYLSDVGPDGAIAYTPHAGFPIRVREVNGDDWLLANTPARSVRLLGHQQVILETPTGWHFVNLAAVDRLPSPCYGLVVNGDWCAYQDTGDGGRVVVRRCDDGTRGWVIPAPLAYGIDLYVTGASIRVGFARAEGEQPGDFVVGDFALSQPMVPLVSEAPPIPVPPVPPETPMQLPEFVRQILLRFAARFPLPQTPGGGQEHEDRCRDWCRMFAEQVHFDTGNNSWGVKRSAGPQSKDTIAKEDNGRLWAWDLMNGAGTGLPTLNEHPAVHDVTGQTFIPVVAVNHLGIAPPIPQPPIPGPQPPVPQPPPSDQLGQILYELRRLNAHFGVTR